MPAGASAAARVAAISTSCCGSARHSAEKELQRRARELVHLLEEARRAPATCAPPATARIAPKPRASSFSEQRACAVVDPRLQAHAVPHIEVPRAGRMRERDLLAVDFVLVAIDDRPQRLARAREAAGEHAGLQRLLVRRPVRADHERRELPLDRRDPPQRLGVARRELIPDAPDVLPRGVADAVEEHVLQVVVAVAAPAVLDVHDVARLEPLELEHRRGSSPAGPSCSSSARSSSECDRRPARSTRAAARPACPRFAQASKNARGTPL